MSNAIFQLRVYALIIIVGLGIGLSGCDQTKQLPKNEGLTASVDLRGAHLLVFSKTAGWRHDSIPAGIQAFQKLATEHGFTLTASEDASLFNDEDLPKFNAIVFLNTTLDVLNDEQQLAMERYIQAGGGFIGIHAAADTEWQGDWFWYRNLVGAVFKNHPNEPSNVQAAKVDVLVKEHPATEALPPSFTLPDEWYNYRDLYEFINVLAKVDESTYSGGEHQHDHPISWYHEYDGGRSFYTGMGHSIETFANEHFLAHLVGGIRYAVGANHKAHTMPLLDYSKSRPEDNRFIKKEIIANLNEPVKFAFLPNGDALIALRPGIVKRVNLQTGSASDAAQLNTYYDKFLEIGLIGIAVDPDFANSPWIYTAYSIKDQHQQLHQRLARFQWRDEQLDLATEQILLEYPIDATCCHTGGGLEFGKDGELYFSTGDNTNPHEQDGYGPIDLRPNATKNDALRSAGNTMDLRGKILRIKPLPTGGYAIPPGNLFSDPTLGRAEIYVMGARNPYSISFDKTTDSLFFSDVGPDASADSELKGARGYDEINRAMKAGNFGWPFAIGKNHPYKMYDYLKQQTGGYFELANALNASPRNTGIKQVPVAEPAFIAYPYGISDEYPELGTGGRTALVAQVFQVEHYPSTKHRYPEYYDNKLFILDFMRNWVKAVSFNEQGQIYKIEPFAPQIGYALPIAARFSPEGSLYVLEYGMSWFTHNPDARLVRIEYVGAGNRPPIAELTLDKHQSGAPANFTATARGSLDLDGDKISYQWSLSCIDKTCSEQSLGKRKEQTVNITNPGKYNLRLKVTDAKGEKDTIETELSVGNEPPSISVSIEGNNSFFWPDTQFIDYRVHINDQEDGALTTAQSRHNPLIKFDYTSPAEVSAQGHQMVSLVDRGKDLVTANNCLGCHKLDEKMVGPAFMEVAEKYKNNPKAMEYLVNKIGNGGSGVWGEMNMPGFSGLNENDRKALASYVLSLLDENILKSLALSGRIELKKHRLTESLFKADEPFIGLGESYDFTVTYLDKGAKGIEPLSTTLFSQLKPARFEFASFDQSKIGTNITRDKFMNKNTIKLNASGEWLTIDLGEYDLEQVKTIKLGFWNSINLATWQAQLLSHHNGDTTIISSTTFTGAALDKFQRISLFLTLPRGHQHLSLAIKSEAVSDAVLQLNDIAFEKN